MSNPWVERIALLWKILGPIVLVVGFTNNTLTLVVLNNIENKHSTHLFFKSLAIADFVYLAVEGLSTWIQYQFGVDLKDTNLWLCVLLKWWSPSLRMFSRLTIASMTFQRALHANRTVRARKNWQTHSAHTLTVTRTVMACLVVFCFSFFFYHAFVLTYRQGKCTWKLEYLFTGREIMVLLNCTFFSFVPYTVMIWSSVYLVLVLRRRVASSKKISRITLSTITMASVCVVLDLPYSVFSIAILNSGETMLSVYYFFCSLALILTLLNSSVKFFIYYLVGPVFSYEAHKLLTKCTVKSQIAPDQDEATPVFDF